MLWDTRGQQGTRDWIGVLAGAGWVQSMVGDCAPGYPISLFYTSVHHIRHLLKEEVFDFLLTLSRRQTRGLWRGERVVFQKRGRKLGKEMKEGAERGMRELSGAWEACVGAAAGQANMGR